MDKKLHLDPKYLKEIIGLLNWRLKDTNIRVFAFGSRATGKHRPSSDVDLALDNNGIKLDPIFLEELRSYFEMLRIPQEVDIVDLNAISNEFRKLIEDDLIEVHYRD